MTCMWLSIKPGITRRLLASMTRVVGPASFITFTSSPTATNRPPAMAAADDCGLRGSSVAIRALRRIRSGSMFIVVAARALHPSERHLLARQHTPRERRHLLAEQDADEPENRDHRRRRRAHVQKTIDRPDEQADGERHHVSFRAVALVCATTAATASCALR